MTRRLVLLVSVTLLSACEQAPPTGRPAMARPQVIASFYTLYEFTRQVAGATADVTSLVPTGVEPHDWEPSPQDLTRVEKAQVFIRNGAGFEPWADKLLANLAGRGPRVIDATHGIDLLNVEFPAGGDRREGAGTQEHRHPEAVRKDPHVWLDPVLAQVQVETIRAGLAAADSPNAERYATGARALTERLGALHAAYERGLADCERREIVVSHAAFGYPARRYRLIQTPVMGLSPAAEPSPAEMARIVRLARRHRVTHIFFETLVAPRLAEALAREVGARTLVLNPIEGLTREEAAAGKGYVALMEQNLENLRVALGCR